MTGCYRHPGVEATHTVGRAPDWTPADPAEPDRWPYRTQPDEWEPSLVCTPCAEALIRFGGDAANDLVTEL